MYYYILLYVSYVQGHCIKPKDGCIQMYFTVMTHKREAATLKESNYTKAAFSPAGVRIALPHRLLIAIIYIRGLCRCMQNTRTLLCTFLEGSRTVWK